MNRLDSRGFSLVELAVTLVVIGLMLGIGIPAFQSFNQTQQLKGATENIAGQIRLMRETAIGTGTTQTMHFTQGYLVNGQLTDYHIHNGLTVGAVWKLPTGMNFNWAAGTNSVIMSGPDGRMTSFGMIIVQDPKARLDTVSVLASGMVLTK